MLFGNEEQRLFWLAIFGCFILANYFANKFLTLAWVPFNTGTAFHMAKRRNVYPSPP